MIPLIGIIAAMATILGAGFGAVALCSERKIPTSELVTLSWFWGMAIVSLTLWIFSFFLRGVTLQAAVTFCCALLCLVGLKNYRRHRKPAPVRLRLSGPEITLLCLLGLEMALIVYGSFAQTLAWDGLLIWELKARFAFLNGGALPSSYFTDSAASFSHPEYPLGLPLTEMWLYLWIGDCDQYWIKMLGPIFYLMGMILLAQSAYELTNKRWVGLLIATLFLFTPPITSPQGGVLGGYADLPLAFFYLGAVAYLLRYLLNGRRFTLIMFIAFAATLPWIKREGAILWGLLAITGAFVIWRRQNLTAAVLSLLPGICIIIAWSLFLLSVRATTPADFIPITMPSVFANAGRIGTILHTLIAQITTLERWNLFWIAVAFSFFGMVWRQRSTQALLVTAAIIFPIGTYCSLYIFSAWPNYIAHVEHSLTRLLVQVTPVAWLAIALALRATEPKQQATKISS